MPEHTHYHDPPPPPKKSHAGAIAGLVILLFIILILVIPLPTPFSRQIQTDTVPSNSMDSSSPGYLRVVANSSVSGTWSTASGQPVLFLVLDSSGVRVFSGSAGSGSFTFVANSQDYWFVAITLIPDTVTVSGTVNQALIAGLFSND